MKRFAELYTVLDGTTKTSAKIEALVDYWRSAPAADAAWAVSFLIGRKPRQVVPAARLRLWAAEEAGIPDWLFDASYQVVGDLAETISLVLPAASGQSSGPFHRLVEEWLLPLRGLPEPQQRAAVVAQWRELAPGQRFVWNKLITGGFRVGVSQKLVVRSLALARGIAESVIAHRLMGLWQPRAEFFHGLFADETKDADASRPYPFFLAAPLAGAPAALGEIALWQAEWKWDGIRAQLIRRAGRVFIWSRGGELITEKFPEIRAAAAGLPDGSVLDGEILAWKGGQPLGFAHLQRRIGRKQLGARLLAAVPAVLMAYDLLELNGEDLRARALSARSAALDSVVAAAAAPCIRRSPTVPAGSWEDLVRLRQEARSRGVEGLMLKRSTSGYGVGRRRGDWWKWKVDPLSVDAVLIYAQPGHGRRSALFTDYTFAVWDKGELVPFAKAYSGLTDMEIQEVDRFIRRSTRERFGPVRSVAPELVFEIAFESIRRSPRHRSGVAVRFPRIARRRSDKSAADADTLETVKALLHEPQETPDSS
jgi:DNA ligase-1